LKGTSKWHPAISTDPLWSKDVPGVLKELAGYDKLCLVFPTLFCTLFKSHRKRGEEDEVAATAKDIIS